MEAKILNVYDNEALPGRGLMGSHGEAFVITVGNDQILLDTGWKAETLRQNLATLGVDPDRISRLVLSHGHVDHTGGLAAFLEARIGPARLPILAHPDVRESKALKTGETFTPIGFPELSPLLLAKVEFRFSQAPQEILPGLFTLGEIPLAERLEKPGAEPQAFHKIADQWEWDPILDDLSLVLKTDLGLAIITGCCHAGLLNTCATAARTFNEKIHAVIGGTHMMRYTEEEVDHVGDALAKDYGSPRLYLNHCTGKKAVAQLRERFGPDIVHDCFAGTEITFNLPDR